MPRLRCSVRVAGAVRPDAPVRAHTRKSPAMAVPKKKTSKAKSRSRRASAIGDTGGLEVIEASEVIGMDDDGAKSVRTMKDSSLVRAAEAVRDGRASAMISAGNTGATMASALLRMGRIKGVKRPAIATPIPVPGGTPTILLDAGANAEAQPEWLRQVAQMGAVLARARYGIAKPRVG